MRIPERTGANRIRPSAGAGARGGDGPGARPSRSSSSPPRPPPPSSSPRWSSRTPSSAPLRAESRAGAGSAGGQPIPWAERPRNRAGSGGSGQGQERESSMRPPEAQEARDKQDIDGGRATPNPGGRSIDGSIPLWAERPSTRSAARSLVLPQGPSHGASGTQSSPCPTARARGAIPNASLRLSGRSRATCDRPRIEASSSWPPRTRQRQTSTSSITTTPHRGLTEPCIEQRGAKMRLHDAQRTTPSPTTPSPTAPSPTRCATPPAQRTTPAPTRCASKRRSLLH